MSDGDRPKKSWREIDASRDRSSGRAPRRDPEERSRQKVEKTAAYSKYKSQLDKLFTPGGAALPEAMRAKLGPTTPEAEAKKSALEALKANPAEEALRACVDQGVSLPEDPRLLMSLLDVKDEALLRPVLEALIALVEGGKKPNRMLLIQKLDSFANRVTDDELLALAKELKSAIA
jgi:hypothetical protein